MGTVIGEASAVAGVLQFGFSLATAIHAYVGDYKDAPDDIKYLAIDINAVVLEAQAIRNLVNQSQVARDLDAAGAGVAEKCVGDLERYLQNLTRLLSDAGVSRESPEYLVSGRLVVSRRMKVRWPLIKTKVEEVQQKLDRTRIQILVARLCLEVHVGSTPVKREANSRIPGLMRHLERLKRVEKSGRELREGVREMRNPRIGDPAPMTRRHPRIEGTGLPDGKAAGVLRRKTQPIDGLADERLTAVTTSDGGDRVEEIVQKLREELRQELLNDEKKKKDDAAREKRLKDEAVEEYKHRLQIDVDSSKNHATVTRKRLEDIYGLLDKTAVDREIDRYVLEEQSQKMGEEVANMVLAAPNRNDMTHTSIQGLPPSIQEISKPKKVRFAKLAFWKKKPSSDNLQDGSPRSNLTEGYGSLHSTVSSTGSTRSTASETSPNIWTVNLVLSYATDTMDQTDCCPFDGSNILHHPCDAACDFTATINVWSQVPQYERAFAMSEVYRRFGSFQWKLHAAIHIVENSQLRRVLLPGFGLSSNKLLARRGKNVVLLIFSVDDREIDPEMQASRRLRRPGLEAREMRRATSVREREPLGRARYYDGRSNSGSSATESGKRYRWRPLSRGREIIYSDDSWRPDRPEPRYDSTPLPPPPPMAPRPDPPAPLPPPTPYHPIRSQQPYDFSDTNLNAPPRRYLEERRSAAEASQGGNDPYEYDRDRQTSSLRREAHFQDGYDGRYKDPDTQNSSSRPHTYQVMPSGTAVYEYKDRATDESRQTKMLQLKHELDILTSEDPGHDSDESVEPDDEILRTQALVLYTGGDARNGSYESLNEQGSMSRVAEEAPAEITLPADRVSLEPIPGIKVSQNDFP
jgi:hypothetical protein